MVARVGRIDGDERQPAQVREALQRRGFRRLGLSQGLGREAHGNAIDVGRDQGGGARVVLATDLGDQPGAFGPVGPVAVGVDLDQNQVAINQVASFGLRQNQRGPGPAIHGFDARLAPGAAHDAQHAIDVLPEALDEPRLPNPLDGSLQAHKQSVAQAGRAASLFPSGGSKANQRRIGAGARGANEQVAVGVALDDIGHDHRGQLSRP